MKIILYLAIGLSFQVISQTTILTEDFQNGIPTDWKFYNVDGFTSVDPNYTNPWILTSDPDDATNQIIGSTSYFQPVGKANRWAVSPTLNLGSYGNQISWKVKSKDASFLDGYIVLGSNSGTDIADFKDTLYIQKAENSYWTQRVLNLSEKGYNSQNIHIAFVNNTNNGFKLFLDSILVEKENSLGIEQLSTQDFTLFPNPVYNVLNIKSSSIIQSITLFNSLGQKLIQENKSTSLSLEKLESGVYIVEISSNNNKIRKQITKM